MSSLKINIHTLVQRGKGACRLKAHVHVQEERGRLKLRKSSVRTLWMTPIMKIYFIENKFILIEQKYILTLRERSDLIKIYFIEYKFIFVE